jgi:hypothetical protein
MPTIVAFVVDHQFFGANSQDRKRCVDDSLAGHAETGQARNTHQRLSRWETQLRRMADESKRQVWMKHSTIVLAAGLLALAFSEA